MHIQKPELKFSIYRHSRAAIQVGQKCPQAIRLNTKTYKYNKAVNFCLEAGGKLGFVDGTEAYVRRLLYSISFIDGLSLSTTWVSIQGIQYSN